MGCPPALRGALREIAASGEIAHLEALRDEALESYARSAAADAHARGSTDVLAADIEDLAAWLRQDAPRRRAIAELARGARARDTMAALRLVAEDALRILDARGIAPDCVARLRSILHLALAGADLDFP